MRTLAPVLVIALALPSPTLAIDAPDLVERKTLEAALFLAGPGLATLPIELASSAPDGASQGVEGWTIYRADGQSERIFIYTGSGIIRCARWPHDGLLSHECLVRLASVIVHEAWHFQHGRSEADAYGAQIIFLLANHAPVAQISAVLTARDRIVAAARKPAEARSLGDTLVNHFDGIHNPETWFPAAPSCSVERLVFWSCSRLNFRKTLGFWPDTTYIRDTGSPHPNVPKRLPDA